MLRISKVLFIALIALAQYSYLLPSVFAELKSTNYLIKDFSFGSFDTNDSSSTNYSVFGVGGDSDNGEGKSTNFGISLGFNETIEANVPPAPTFTNPANYYNKLRLTINTGGNPTDTKFAIAISTDNFATDTKYVQNNQTVGATLGIEDWQTQTGWESTNGYFNIIGLTPGVTYTVKVAAMQGSFTQTGFGPTVSATTDHPTLSFDIDVSTTDSETASPYQLNLGTLIGGSIVTSTQRIWIDVSTNANSGAVVYINGTNGGLRSSVNNYTINSVTDDLVGILEGYGIQTFSVNQTSGGPLRVLAPYNGVSENVGIIDSTKRSILDSSNLPIISGRAAFVIKSKVSTTTPPSNYSEVTKFTAAGVF